MKRPLFIFELLLVPTVACVLVAAGPATKPSSRPPATRPAATIKPRWRLKPGAAVELQEVIDSQAETRKQVLDQLAGERNQVEYVLDSISRVARQVPARREWSKQFGEEYRARFQEITRETRALDRYAIPAFGDLQNFFAQRFVTERPFEVGSSTFRTRAFAGNHVIGHCTFAGATVVNVVDAHTAVVRPRGVDNVDYVLHDFDHFYAWVEEVHAIHDREPVIATKLPSTDGWKPGDIVSLGNYWIVRGQPVNADGALPSPAITMEAFSPDALEPIETASTAPATDPTGG